MQERTYRLLLEVGQVEDFAREMMTDFPQIDFPKLTMSLSSTRVKVQLVSASDVFPWPAIARACKSIH